jgi:hypothetical protein
MVFKIFYLPRRPQALLDYLRGETRDCCPAQIDKDFTAEREQELTAVLKRVRQTEETAVMWLQQLKLEDIKQEEGEGEGAVKDENVNGRAVFNQLKELLQESWQMSDSQVESDGIIFILLGFAILLSSFFPSSC